MNLSDQLRKIIRESGLSRYRICKMASLDPSQMHRFLRGEGRLTNDSLDRLGEALGLRFVTTEKGGE